MSYTVLYQFLETGTPNRNIIGRDQLLEFIDFYLYPFNEGDISVRNGISVSYGTKFPCNTDYNFKDANNTDYTLKY